MALEDLPELRRRIITCSAQNFFNVYDLTPGDYELRSYWSEGYNNIERLYEDTTDWMKREQAIAITDFRINRVVINNVINVASCGTSIYLKKKEDKGTKSTENR